MTTATRSLFVVDHESNADRSLGISVATSIALHVTLIVALAAAHTTLSLAPSEVGLNSPLAVDLVEPRERIASELLQPLPPLVAPELMHAIAPLPPAIASTATPIAEDSAMMTLNLPRYVHAGPPSPNGRVAVGPLGNPEQVSAATAARLLQRFPLTAARTPKLNGAVITSYPVEAARSHTSARIAVVLTVDASGRIVEHDTKLMPDDPMFHSAVTAALASVTFTPAESNGKPMAYWLILEFVFDIDPAPGIASATSVTN